MNRKTFIQNACMACAGTLALPGLLASCRATRVITGKLNNDGILVDTDEFRQSGRDAFRPYIVVRNEALLFPICVYRFSATDFAALWMQCAHQGAEVNVMGDFLQCPAHGSEYDNRGRVTNGPAESNLRSFPVSVKGKELFIDLGKT